MKKPVVPAAVQAAFERLMDAYPARGDNPRTPALAVFARLVETGDDPEAIVRAAVRFDQVMTAEKREKRMIPHTRTWLSQRRFDDYLTDAPASAGDALPNPEHPLAFMAEDTGLASWRSYLEPLTVETIDGAIVITARTRFALDHIRKAWWDRQIEARLGPVQWRAP